MTESPTLRFDEHFMVQSSTGLVGLYTIEIPNRLSAMYGFGYRHFLVW